MADDKLDIVLWGATGFTGQLVAAYLAQSRPSTEGNLRWAIAGRNRGRLDQLRRDMAANSKRPTDQPSVLIADSHDRDSLEALARKTKVVCSTVGPFALYGDELVRVAARTGAAYCDITGELDWMHKCISQHQKQAAESGARIVHACGFDSIPSDLGTLMIQNEAMRRHGSPCSEVRFVLTRMKGRFSGGTLASMASFVERLRDPSVRRIVSDPYALDPEGSPRGPDGRDQAGVRFDSDLGVYTGPFIMAGVNTRIVRRSHALLDHPWGRGFRYSESQGHGAGRRGRVRAITTAAALHGFTAAMVLPPTRRLLKRFVLPKPGEGPSEQERRAGFFQVRLVGHGKRSDGTPFRLRGTVAGTQDPGYGETAKMLGESALCLAMDADRTPPRSGFLTPATAMGETLIERLRAAGMTFEVEDWPA